MKREGYACSPKSMKKLRLAESRRITRSDNKKALQHESCLVESTATFASSVATGKGRKRHTKSTPVVAKRTKGRKKRITSAEDGRAACNILHAVRPEKVLLSSWVAGGRLRGCLDKRQHGRNLLLIGSHRKEKDKPPEQFKIVIPKILAYFTVLLQRIVNDYWA
ncbi:Pyridoxal kinase-like protein [Drosera capensis]